MGGTPIIDNYGVLIPNLPIGICPFGSPINIHRCHERSARSIHPLTFVSRFSPFHFDAPQSKPAHSLLRLGGTANPISPNRATAPVPNPQMTVFLGSGLAPSARPGM